MWLDGATAVADLAAVLAFIRRRDDGVKDALMAA
jgi:hypothetical protein